MIYTDQSDTVGTKINTEEDNVEIGKDLKKYNFTGIDHRNSFSALKTLLNCKTLA